MSYDPMFPQQVRMRAESSELAKEDFTPAQNEAGEDHEAHAPGELCVRCGHVIKSGEDVRRSGRGGWVHENC